MIGPTNNTGDSLMMMRLPGEAASIMAGQELVVPRWRKIQKHFQNVMLIGMASEISKNYTYKCVDCSRHNGIKAKAKCAH